MNRGTTEVIPSEGSTPDEGTGSRLPREGIGNAAPAGSDSRRAWAGLTKPVSKIFAPRLSEEELDRGLNQLRAELPAPVFWLLGKAQSGKTSIIRALTGATKAEVGDGFRPCTRTAQLYAFPNEENCFIRFLDTRGLGEVDYDPTADIGALEAQSHCLVVVIRAMDHAQQGVLVPLKNITKAHPEWPLIVVQTALHEGYPWIETRHVDGYPYTGPPFSADVPGDLARSLLAQRAWFDGMRARFVPVDFTLPEDGFQPQHYGLDAFWAAIEEAIPMGLRAMLERHRNPLRDAYLAAAIPHILSYSALAGAAALVPVPLVDLPVVTGVQAKMCHSIASIYGQQLTKQRIGEVLGSVGFGLAARLGIREAFKLIPVWGSAITGLFAAASTYALGCTLCAYFGYVRKGELPEPEALRRLYREQYQEGRRRMDEYLRHVGPGQDSRAPTAEE
jgi:uncharacterized protein (DUF697 family)